MFDNGLSEWGALVLMICSAGVGRRGHCHCLEVVGLMIGKAKSALAGFAGTRWKRSCRRKEIQELRITCGLAKQSNVKRKVRESAWR